MLSGPLAHQKWDRFFRLASNVSRLDLQTTIRYSTSSTSKIASHYKSACRAHKRKAARRRVTLLRSTDGSATIYLGSRQSDAFGRVYQKDAESKLEHYQNAVRYEVELKGKAGISAISTIARTTDPAPHIFSQVRGWFADSSIFYPSLQHAQTALKCIPRTRGDDSRRLAWIESDVRPAVKTLLEHGKLQSLVHALGLSDHVQIIAGPDRQNLAHEESWIQ